MFSFDIKNILRKDIVTHDVFFNRSCEMVEYLFSKNCQYYCSTIPVESLVMRRQVDANPMEITGLMKKQGVVFEIQEKRFLKRTSLHL